MLGDEEFIAQFEACTLPKEQFHHADHVRMAFLYLSRYPAIEALQKFPAALLRFAASLGKPDRYNETVTWAFLFLIRERMARGGEGYRWNDFAAANPDLLNWTESVLKRYYREETLKSDLAKSIFILPDRPV